MAKPIAKPAIASKRTTEHKSNELTTGTTKTKTADLGKATSAKQSVKIVDSKIAYDKNKHPSVVVSQSIPANMSQEVKQNPSRYSLESTFRVTSQTGKVTTFWSSVPLTNITLRPSESAVLTSTVRLPGGNPDAYYMQALQEIDGAIVSNIGPGCIPSYIQDLNRPDCVVEDVTAQADGSFTTSEIPWCGSNGAARPCWQLVMDPRCPQVPGPNGDQQVDVQVLRPPSGTPDHTAAQVACATVPGP